MVNVLVHQVIANVHRETSVPSTMKQILKYTEHITAIIQINFWK